MAEINKPDLISEDALQAPLQLDKNLKKLVATMDKLVQASRRNTEAIAGARSTTKLKEETAKLTQQQKMLVATQNKVNEALRQNTKTVKSATGAMTGMWRSVKGLLAAFGLVTGLQLFAKTLKSIITLTKEYEATNSKLISVLGVAKSAVRELREQQQQLGATTAFTATQVAELQVEFAKLGFPIQDIKNMTASTLDAALAMGSGLGEQAALTGATLKAFKLDSTEAARVNDVLAKSTASSALNFEKLQTIIPTLAPVAKAYGFSLEATIALQGELANSGFDASSAATATRNIFLKLADTNSELSKSLKEPVKDLPSLVSGLKQLKEEGIDLGAALELTDVRSVAAFATFLDGTDSVLALNKTLEQATGSANRMARVMQDNLAGDVLLAKSAWDGFILSITQGEGVFNRTSRGLVQMAANFLGLITPVTDSTAALVKEQTELNVLVTAIIGTNKEQKVRNTLITELQEKYPNFLKNIDAEGASNEELAKRLKDVNEQFVRKILLTASEQKLNEEARGVVDAIDKEADARKRLAAAERELEDLREQKARDRFNVTLDLEIAEATLKAEQAQKDITDATIERIQAEDELTNKVEEYTKALSVFNDTNNDYFTEGEKIVKQDKERAKGIRELSKEVEGLNTVERLQLQLRLEREAQLRAIQKSGAAKMKETAQKLADDIAKIDQEAYEKKILIVGLISDVVQQSAFTADAILFNSLDKQSMALDAQLKQLQAKRDLELRLVGDNEEAKAQLLNKFAAQEQQLKRRQAEQDRKKAVFDKVSALFQVGINTAIGVAKAAAAFPLTGGLPWTAVITAIGALQAAAIISKPIPPIPQFAEGVRGFSGGPAVVGEEGAELIRTNKGLQLATGPSLVDLPKGADVFTNEETMRMLAQSALASGNKDSRSGELSNKELKMLAQINKTIKNKSEVHINFSRKGAEAMIRNAETRTKLFNSLYR